jgi:alginate O-acetyltransferase complex protein AlgJ
VTTLHDRDVWFPESRFDGKVVRGKDGWLFLDNDGNHIMLQHIGKLRFTPDQLRQWCAVLETRLAWLRQRGIPYHFMVAPNPHSVFHDKLPDEIDGVPLGSGERRPLMQLIEHLEERRSPARLIYPHEDLTQMKARPIYTQTNTHWTDLGAFVAYRTLIGEVRRAVPVRALGENDLVIHEFEMAGDLGLKVEPREESVHVFLHPRRPQARFLYDNRIFRNGRRIDYECGLAPDVKCLVFGDSFAYMMLPVLAETFGRLVFAHIATLDHSLVEEERPDVVITIMNERFLIRVPVDLPARPLRDWEASKRAIGQMYPPRSATGTSVDSPTPWQDNARLMPVAEADDL